MPLVKCRFTVSNFCIIFSAFSGTFSKVYVAQLKSYPDEVVAIKYLVPTSSPTKVKNELACLQKLGYVLQYTIKMKHYAPLSDFNFFYSDYIFTFIAFIYFIIYLKTMK